MIRKFWRAAQAVVMVVGLFASMSHAGAVMNIDRGGPHALTVEAGDVLNFYGTADASSIDSHSGTINLRYDATVDTIGLTGSATAHLSGGSVQSELSLHDSSIVNITGGSHESVMNYDTSVTNISGGQTYQVFGQGTATINLAGGSVILLQSYENANAYITGGRVTAQVSAGDASTTTIKGGSFSQLALFDQAVVHIYGSGLLLTDGKSDAFWRRYRLTGTLLDGTEIDAVIYTSDSSSIGIANVHLHDVAVVPLPAAGWAGLSLLGLLGAARVRRGQRPARWRRGAVTAPTRKFDGLIRLVCVAR